MKRKLLVLLLAEVLLGHARAMDIDTGKDAVGAAKMMRGAPLLDGSYSSGKGGWFRLRGIAVLQDGSGEQSAKSKVAVEETKEALQRIRERGLKSCVLLRWPADWRKVYLPKDLREAYENGRKLGAAYGDLVDAWEVDNEPDLGFVPEAAERYAAFLKATWLGLKAGAAEVARKPETGNLKPEGSDSNSGLARAPLVLMGALGLPPGLWLERFAANDGFSYTDGFNYHYYGYADDFTAVYKQQERAVGELTAALQKPDAASAEMAKQTGNLKPEGSASDPVNQAFREVALSQVSGLRSQVSLGFLEKSLPIFLTEVGYGMLGKAARDTTDGRLRQWRWFKSVGEQANDLRIEAPMAFYLPPYLEYDTSEFGLTQKPGAGSSELGAGKFRAGGINYTAADFGLTTDYTDRANSWARLIGKQLDGNEITPALAEWISQRAKSKERGVGSRSWTISTAAPSPVVIDFLPGEGLSPIKRYGGSFVTGLTAGEGPRAKGEAKEPAPGNKPPLPPSSLPSAPSRSEEFMIHVRTANGNLYEVYPTRQATVDWQSYSESEGNFTMSFYGRAELPWRFKDNKPASLVVVMYPKQLPATYEFRRVKLVWIGQAFNTENTVKAMRYGHGKAVLYNFSDKEISGRLTLPADVERVDPKTLAAISADSVLKLLPGERREIPVTIKVLWEHFERINVPISFVSEDQAVPPAHFLTAFMPDIGGMKTTVVAEFLAQKTEDGEPRTASGNAPSSLKSQVSGRSNPELVATRVRATEEAPMVEQEGCFVQQGAKVERMADGFTVTITGRPSGKEQRVEMEIPWPEHMVFTADEFLNMEYRLKPGGGK